MTRDEMIRCVLATRHMVSWDEAEDVVQTVLLRLFEKHGTVDLPDNYLVAWLRGVAKHHRAAVSKEIDAKRLLAVTPVDHIGVDVCRNGHILDYDTLRERRREEETKCLICKKLKSRRQHARWKERYPSAKPHAARVA